MVRLINVFLSSPSDVAEERERAALAVDEVNDALAHILGFHIDILRWNARIGPGTGVGVGRPQERVNPLVRKADLFVGIFWKRFGQPTGEYESGSEEEFNIAMERWREHGDPAGWPEIWMFFRDVDEKLLDDPEPQLQEVLSLKRQLKKETYACTGNTRGPHSLSEVLGHYWRPWSVNLCGARGGCLLRLLSGGYRRCPKNQLR